MLELNRSNLSVCSGETLVFSENKTRLVDFLPTSCDLSSADNLCKQFEPRSGPTKCWA